MRSCRRARTVAFASVVTMAKLVTISPLCGSSVSLQRPAKAKSPPSGRA